MDYKKATAKLVNILKKQNTALNKLAQAAVDQEIKGYLEGALNVAVANTGVDSSFRIAIHKNPGQILEDGVSSEENYVVTASFNPQLTDNAVKQKLMNNFYAYIKGNRPELDGRVSFIFG